ncbi:MAG: hypothetical protein RLZZ221_3032, partial [Verrucomicrobiota bacterium]
LLREAGVTFHFRTRGPASQTVEVSVADTTGELRRLTQLADVVFVGKSLPPHTEGQTPVEAAALGKPLLFGPGMANFRTIAGDQPGLGRRDVVQGDYVARHEPRRLGKIARGNKAIPRLNP